MKQLQKAWIFISHSNKDLEQVRRLRNEIESLGGEPLLFFLKCVSDHDELDGLLKREIDARQYFILCDSAHTRSSRWVQEEVSHVRTLQGKVIEEIDLHWSWEKQASIVRRLLRTATLFPAFAHPDKGVVGPLIKKLRSQDFALYDPFSELPATEDLACAIFTAIDRSKFFLDFLSDRSLRSHWCRREADYIRASSNDPTNYIPVILERTSAVEAAVNSCSAQCIDFSTRDVRQFVSALRARLYS